jgi:hypothetical protein
LNVTSNVEIESEAEIDIGLHNNIVTLENNINIFPESDINKTEKLIIEWKAKYNISLEATDHLLKIFHSPEFHINSLGKKWNNIDEKLKKRYDISRIIKMGLSPLLNKGTIPISLFNIKELLTKYLETPIGFSSIIPKFSGNLQEFSSFTTGIFFQSYCDYINENFPEELPLCLSLFYDPFSLSKKNKIGGIYIGILNVDPEVWLSPKSKLTLCLLPYGVSIDVVMKDICDQLIELEKNPFEIKMLNKIFKFRTTLAMYCGDSKVKRIVLL